jgi:hypothetical protein
VPGNKTIANSGDVASFLAQIENNQRAVEAQVVVSLMERITQCPPVMWGDSIIGFDSYTYSRKDGSTHSFMITGLSPRKSALTIYVMPGFTDFQDQLTRLGPHRHSKSCLYITRLSNIDLAVLENIIHKSVQSMRAKYHS